MIAVEKPIPDVNYIYTHCIWYALYIYIGIYICMCVCLSLCLSVCLSVCVCVCTHTYMHMYIYAHVYICTCIYMWSKCPYRVMAQLIGRCVSLRGTKKTHIHTIFFDKKKAHTGSWLS